MERRSDEHEPKDSSKRAGSLISDGSSAQHRGVESQTSGHERPRTPRITGGRTGIEGRRSGAHETGRDDLGLQLEREERIDLPACDASTPSPAIRPSGCELFLDEDLDVAGATPLEGLAYALRVLFVGGETVGRSATRYNS